MWQHFKKVFLTGIFAIAPLAMTYWILKITFEFLDNVTSPFLRKVDINIPGLGLLLTNIPIVKSIYSNIKQITQTFSGTSSRNFQSVVYLEYPRKRLWTLAFVTGSSTNDHKDEFFHLFIPTTPNPTSGFFIMVPQEDTIPAGMNVEEALKAVISGGMLAREKHQIS